jgi:hypothetical protein
MFPWNWGNKGTNTGYLLKARWITLWLLLKALTGGSRLGKRKEMLSSADGNKKQEIPCSIW